MQVNLIPGMCKLFATDTELLGKITIGTTGQVPEKIRVMAGKEIGARVIEYGF